MRNSCSVYRVFGTRLDFSFAVKELFFSRSSLPVTLIIIRHHAASLLCAQARCSPLEHRAFSFRKNLPPTCCAFKEKGTSAAALKPVFTRRVGFSIRKYSLLLPQPLSSEFCRGSAIVLKHTYPGRLFNHRPLHNFISVDAYFSYLRYNRTSSSIRIKDLRDRLSMNLSSIYLLLAKVHHTPGTLHGF